MTSVFKIVCPTRIAFAGRSEAGKSTAARYVQDLTRTPDNVWPILSHSRPLKNTAEILICQLGLNSEKCDMRELWQTLGKWSRNQELDCLSKALLNRVPTDNGCIVDDVRFLNEAINLKRHGFKLVWITRPGHVNALTPGQKADVSENSLSGEEPGIWDYKIVNGDRDIFLMDLLQLIPNLNV